MAWYGSVWPRDGGRPAKKRTIRRRKKQLPPFPVRQMIVLCLCRFSEPIAFMSIFPYIYSMVEDFGITEDKNQISMYAGMIISAFVFAEFMTGFIWGRLSDKLGRKPIMMSGLVGTGISSLIFGFSRSLPMAMFARALGGILNGNIGVLQTTVAELVPVKEYQPRAFSLMPLVWAVGSIFGPVVGGALARPCEAYPTLFARGTIWDRYPYLLPNLFSVVVVCGAVAIGILFFEETHAVHRHRRDVGIELGRWLAERSCLRVFNPWAAADRRQARREEKQPLLLALDIDVEGAGGGDDDQLPGYAGPLPSPHSKGAALSHLRGIGFTPEPPTPTITSAVATPESMVIVGTGPDQPRPSPAPCGSNLASGVAVAAKTKEQLQQQQKQLEPAGGSFPKTVKWVIVTYGILAFHTIVFDQLLPVFLATSPFQEKAPISLPFRFADGIGMDPKDVGFILAVQGFWSMFTTLQVFPWVAQRVGPLLIYQVLAFFYVPVYFFVPYLLLLTGASRTWAIYIIVIWKSTIASLSYPANAIIITNTAPAENLGTINGVAASTASLCRAFGPTVSGALNAWGLAAGYAGVPWWTAAVAATLASILGLRIVDPKSRPRSKDDDDDLWEEVEVDERGNVIGVVGAVPATEADEALVRSATTVRALPNNDALLPLPPVPRPAMSAGPSSASLSGSSTRTERTSLLTS